MTEAEARRVIREDPEGSIVKRLEAIEVAEAVLGEDCTMESVWRWAERTTKEYLQCIADELENDEKCIRRLYDRYMQEYSGVFGTGIRYDRDKVQTSIGGQGLDGWYVNVEEMLKELNSAILAFREKRERYASALSGYPVLCLKYVDRFSVGRISRRLHISRRSVWRAHDREIEKIEENMSLCKKPRDIQELLTVAHHK